MSSYVRVTEVTGAGQEAPTLINVDAVIRIAVNQSGDVTVVLTEGNVKIKEAFADIQALLEPYTYSLELMG